MNVQADLQENALKCRPNWQGGEPEPSTRGANRAILNMREGAVPGTPGG
jgi:hypothetical protein